MWLVISHLVAWREFHLQSALELGLLTQYSYFVGYGPEVWSYGDYYWWVPVVASLCGGPVGGLVYSILTADTGSSIHDLWPWFMRIRRNFKKYGKCARVDIDQDP